MILLTWLAFLGSAATSGDVLWQHEMADAGPGLVAVARGYVVLLRQGRAVAVEADSGHVVWEVVGAFEQLATDGTMAYLASSGGVQARDARDGTLSWQVDFAVPEGSTFGLVGNLLLHAQAGSAAPTVRALDRHSGDELWSWSAADADLASNGQRRLHVNQGTVVVEATFSGGYTYSRFTGLDARTGTEEWTALGDSLIRGGERNWAVVALAPNPHAPRMLLVDGRTNLVSRWWEIGLLRRPDCGHGVPVGAIRVAAVTGDYLWLEVQDGCGHFLQRLPLGMQGPESEVLFASEAGDAFAPTNSSSHVLLQRQAQPGADAGGSRVFLLTLSPLNMLALPSAVQHADRGWLLGDLLVVGNGSLLSVVSLADATLRLRHDLLATGWEPIGVARGALLVRAGKRLVALRIAGT
jgi:hypothetical protein